MQEAGSAYRFLGCPNIKLAPRVASLLGVVVLGQCCQQDTANDNEADKQKMAAHNSAFAVLLNIWYGSAKAIPGIAQPEEGEHRHGHEEDFESD